MTRPDLQEAASVLGVAPTATGEEVRAAYLRGVKEHPPDRDPRGFEGVRDAYDLLREAGSRSMLHLFTGDPAAPLVSLLDGDPPARLFLGPEPWLAALRKR